MEPARDLILSKNRSGRLLRSGNHYVPPVPGRVQKVKGDSSLAGGLIFLAISDSWSAGDS